MFAVVQQYVHRWWPGATDGCLVWVQLITTTPRSNAAANPVAIRRNMGEAYTDPDRRPTGLGICQNLARRRGVSDGTGHAAASPKRSSPTHRASPHGKRPVVGWQVG